MKTELLEKLKEHFDTHTYSILCDDSDSIKMRENKRTDADRLHDKVKECENPKLKLYDAILHAEMSPTKEAMLNAAKAAAELDDFVTALYWHKKAKLTPVDVDEKFYRLKLSALASAQTKYSPEAKPLFTHKEMLHDTELAKKLEDKVYLNLETECKVLENKYYNKEFDEIAETVLTPRYEKYKKTENTGFLKLAIVWLLGIAWLIFSVPKVWVWSDNFFSQHLGLLFIVFWAVPVAYAIALLIGIFMLGEAVAGTKSDDMSKDLDKTIEHYIAKIEQNLSETEQYTKRREMNAGIPDEFCDYGSRLMLALLSRIYGEERIEKVVKLPNKTIHSSWVERFAGKKLAGEHPYELMVNTLLDKEFDLESIFLARELTKKEGAHSTELKSEIEKSFHGFGGPYLQKAEAMRSLCYAFLYEEIRNGEESDNDEQLGEAYYLLYVLSGRRNNAAGQKAVDCKNRKMLFLAMEAAINNWTDSSFGYSRYNAARYIEELEKVGDPDGARLRTKLNDRLAWEKGQERIDNAIEAKEREQAEREAIYKRWQAESKADAIERETNMYFHGDYSTDFERTITGKMSQRDYTINKIWREKFLEHQE